jgi:hypothetical protein
MLNQTKYICIITNAFTSLTSTEFNSQRAAYDYENQPSFLTTPGLYICIICRDESAILWSCEQDPGTAENTIFEPKLNAIL